MKKKRQRSPAFQFYPADFLMEVAVMTTDEVGAYTLLKSICWYEESLPSDIEELASIAKLTPERFQPMWDRRISRCFKQRSDGRWTHPGLDKEAKKQEDWRAKCSAAGVKSSAARRNASEAESKGSSTNVEPPLKVSATTVELPLNVSSDLVEPDAKGSSTLVQLNGNQTSTLHSSSSSSSSSSNKETTMTAGAAQGEPDATEPIESARGPGSLRQRLCELFLTAYSESHEGARYQIQRPADFVQLDRCLSAQGEISEENWRRAVTNYLASPQHSTCRAAPGAGVRVVQPAPCSRSKTNLV